MQCWLVGAYALEKDETHHLDRPIAIQLSAPSLDVGTALRGHSLCVTGELCARQLARRAVIDGAVVRSGRSVRYALRFTDDSGHDCELQGTQEIAWQRPPQGFSMVAGRLLRRNKPFARVRLRLDPRDWTLDPWAAMRGLIAWA